jgi:methyltransferase
MSPAAWVLALVTLERGAELIWSHSNTRRLLAMGAREAGASHYPLIVALHASWLVGLWGLGRDRPVSIPWLVVFAVLQAGRIWVLATLGRRWTTRIIVLPGETLVRRGPYRFIPHPNYAVVAGEILVLPLALGLVAYGLVFFVLNAAVLTIRIRAETQALHPSPLEGDVQTGEIEDVRSGTSRTVWLMFWRRSILASRWLR